MEVFAALMNKIDSWIWGLPMLVLLCGTHIFMTFRTGFIQRKTLTGIRLSVTKDPDSPGDVSQFQALTTALASTIGTGNIIGVGTAIYLGGPGAVLWCWLTGVFGIATKYAESLIAVKYRVQTADGRMMGGAMYALERGLKWKKFGKVMAVLFALFAMLASFGIGCGTQINAIAEVLETNLPISLPRIAIGIIFGIITAIIIIGGIESIAVVCEKTGAADGPVLCGRLHRYSVRQLRFPAAGSQGHFRAGVQAGRGDRRTGRRRYPSGAAVRRGTRPVLE